MDVAIAGIGVVTPVEHEAGVTWASLCSGINGIGKIDTFNTSALKSGLLDLCVTLSLEQRCAESDPDCGFGTAISASLRTTP